MTLRQVGAASQEERIGDLQIFIRLSIMFRSLAATFYLYEYSFHSYRY